MCTSPRACPSTSAILRLRANRLVVVFQGPRISYGSRGTRIVSQPTWRNVRVYAATHARKPLRDLFVRAWPGGQRLCSLVASACGNLRPRRLSSRCAYSWQWATAVCTKRYVQASVYTYRGASEVCDLEVFPCLRNERTNPDSHTYTHNYAHMHTSTCAHVYMRACMNACRHPLCNIVSTNNLRTMILRARAGSGGGLLLSAASYNARRVPINPRPLNTPDVERSEAKLWRCAPPPPTYAPTRRDFVGRAEAPAP